MLAFNNAESTRDAQTSLTPIHSCYIVSLPNSKLSVPRIVRAVACLLHERVTVIEFGIAKRSAVAEFDIDTAFVEAMACERADGISLKSFTGIGFAHLLVRSFV